MKIKEKETLNCIGGGKLFVGIASFIAGIGSFIFGFIEGFTNPKACNNR